MGRRLCTMRRTKSIHHKNIAEGCHLLRQLLVILLLALVEAHVLAQNDFAVLHLADTVDPVLDHFNVMAQQCSHMFAHRDQRELLIVFTFARATQVRHHHYFGTGIHGIFNRRQ